MTIRLPLRKRVKKLTANRKGFSSVIGTTFMVLVMMFLSTSVFLWTLSQNTLYNEALRAKNQEEAERSSENIVALSGNYSVSEVTGEVTVTVVLRNAGSVAVQLMNLWVLDTDPLNRRYANKSLNLNLNPGDVEPNWLTVTIPEAKANHTFTSWFVTARGNTIPLEKEQGVIVASLAQGIGSLALDFYKFRYFEYKAGSGNVLENYPNGTISFNIPKGTEVAYGVVLTNLDPSKKTIVLDSHSLLWVIIPTSDVAHNKWWYIVNVAPNGTISPTYSTISMAYGEIKLLVFASENDLASSSFARQNAPNTVCTVPVFLLPHGTIGGKPYGQNLPFVSLYFF